MHQPQRHNGRHFVECHRDGYSCLLAGRFGACACMTREGDLVLSQCIVPIPDNMGKEFIYFCSQDLHKADCSRKGIGVSHYMPGPGDTTEVRQWRGSE